MRKRVCLPPPQLWGNCTCGLTEICMCASQPSDEESVDVDDGEGGQAQTIRLVKGPVTGAGDEECDARLQGRRGKM
jgi:hypothetical protein